VLVCHDVPAEATGLAQPLRLDELTLGLAELGFSAFEVIEAPTHGTVALRSFDRDARDLRELVDEILLEARRCAGYVARERTRAEDFIPRAYGGHPARPKAVHERRRSPACGIPTRLGLDVGNDD